MPHFLPAECWPWLDGLDRRAGRVRDSCADLCFRELQGPNRSFFTIHTLTNSCNSNQRSMEAVLAAMLVYMFRVLTPASPPPFVVSFRFLVVTGE